MTLVQANVRLAPGPREKLEYRNFAKRDLCSLKKLGTKPLALMVGVHYQPPNLAQAIHSPSSH